MEQKPQNTNAGCLIAIIALVFIIGFSQCDSQQTRQKESQAFESQLHKDPNTWTKEEKQRYNNFAEWQDKQQNK